MVWKTKNPKPWQAAAFQQRQGLQSPIITAFHYPDVAGFTFEWFYNTLEARRYVIYPGKVSQALIRIGNVGHVFSEDTVDLTRQVAEMMAELRGHPPGLA